MPNGNQFKEPGTIFDIENWKQLELENWNWASWPDFTIFLPDGTEYYFGGGEYGTDWMWVQSPTTGEWIVAPIVDGAPDMWAAMLISDVINNNDVYISEETYDTIQNWWQEYNNQGQPPYNPEIEVPEEHQIIGTGDAFVDMAEGMGFKVLM